MALNAAESNRVAIYYIPETVWGTTPTSGTVRIARITSSSIVASKETEQSNEIRSDRMVPSIIEVAASTSGDVEGELSAGTYDDFFQQFLLGAWTENMNHMWVKGSAVAVASTSTVTIASATDYTDYLAANQWIKLEGFTDPENNRYVQVHASTAPAFASGVTTITVAGTPLIVEVGSAFTTVMDAGDVAAFDTAITLAASGNTVAGLSGAEFASLVAGQKVYIEGHDKETGTIVAEAAADPIDTDTLTISDGTTTIVYELHTDSTAIGAGNVYIENSVTEATLATNINAAIMAQFAAGNCLVSSTVATATVTLTNNNNLQGGSIASTAEDATELNLTAFSGGVAGNQGFFTVATVATDGNSFTVDETLVDDSTSASVVVKGSHLRNPGVVADITKQSVSIMTSFTDVNKDLLHDGLRVGSFSMSFEAGSIVSANFSFQGAQTQTNPALPLDNVAYTVLDTTPTEVMNATDNVGTIVHNGTALSTSVMSIEINGDNSLREQKAVGSKFPAGIGYGRFTLEGSVTAYFQDFTLYDAFLDHDTNALEWPVTDANDFRMIFRIPAAKFTANPIAPGGIDEDIMEELEWSAQRDTTLQTMFMIDRFSSIKPFTAA